MKKSFNVVSEGSKDINLTMQYSNFRITRKVQLHETDLGALMHHHNYFLWMEQAEYEMFEHMGQKVVGDLDEKLRGTGWPRSKVSMTYLKPLRFQDQVEIHLKITRIRSAALEYNADFYLLKDDTRELVSVGQYQAIHCLYDASMQQDPSPLPIPDELLSQLAVYQE